MSQHDFETSVPAARELSEDELMQIQGGGVLGDIWEGVKTVAGKVWDVLKPVIRWPPLPLPDPRPHPLPLPRPLPHPLPPGPFIY